LCALHKKFGDGGEADKVAPSSTYYDLTLYYNPYLSKTISSPKLAPELSTKLIPKITSHSNLLITTLP
jgi:hypothetical protein